MRGGADVADLVSERERMAGHTCRRHGSQTGSQLRRRREVDRDRRRRGADIRRGVPVLEDQAIDVGLDDDGIQSADACRQRHWDGAIVAGPRRQPAGVGGFGKKNGVGVERGVGRQVDGVGPFGRGFRNHAKVVANVVRIILHRRPGAKVGNLVGDRHVLARELLGRGLNIAHRQLGRRAKGDRERAAQKQRVTGVSFGQLRPVMTARAVGADVDVPRPLCRPAWAHRPCWSSSGPD